MAIGRSTIVRDSKRIAHRSGLQARGLIKSAFLSRYPVRNVYHATIQKAGSQWIKAIFRDPRIQHHTGLLCYPQHRYEWDEFHERFPPMTYVPGLYISYDLYEEIDKPIPYRTFYVLRDPRNVVVSWYYSMLHTHGLMGKVPKYRRDLQALDFDEGISYCIRALQLKFAFMRSWAYNDEDPNVKIVKLENLSNDPVSGFTSIFEHCGFSVPNDLIAEAVQDYSKDKMRERDLARRESGSMSHYRKESTDWRDVFNEHHNELFERVTGDLVELLGYE